MHRILFAALTLLVSVSPAFAQRCLVDGFKVDLVYQPPDIEHPSVVTCDDAGNLFVGEDPMDMRGPTTKPIDRIIFIRWDKETGKPIRTVFAENLAAVFGLVWHDGALYVMHAPLYSVLRDTDGDGVADERKDLATGFGPPAGVYGFNDHIVTGTRLGLDGYVYVSVGDKGIPKATGADGSTITLEGGGVVRMRLDGTRLEVVSSGTRNHLDVAMDSYDNIFTYDNTDDGLGWWTRFTHHIPTGYYGYPYDYLTHPNRHLPRISEHGGGSPVGAACYREGVWPAVYQDAAFHCEWGKGKVQVFFPRRKGATFEATMEDFMVKDPASQEEFRPQDVCFSPDGKHMYVADWNFGGWVNKKVCGRLYRVTWTGGDRQPPPAPRVTNAAPEADQIRALAHPSHSERMRAQWQLAKMVTKPDFTDEVILALNMVIRKADESPLAKIHAIWTLQEIAERHPSFDPSSLWVEGLKQRDAEVRSQAARALGTRRLKSGTGELIKLLQDPDAQVRMWAAIALGRSGDKSAVPALFAALSEEDVFARFAMIQAIRALGDFSPARAVLTGDHPRSAEAALAALTGQYDERAVQTLSAAVKHARLPGIRAGAIEALADVHHQADPYKEGWWGTQPAKGKPARSKIHDWAGTPTALAAIREALTGKDELVRRAALKVVGDVKDPEAMPLVANQAADETLPDDARIEALKALLANKAPQAKEIAAKIAGDEKASVGLLTEALQLLAALKVREALPAVKHRLSSTSVEVRAKAIDAAVRMAGSEAAEHLIQALRDIHPDVRKAAVKSAGDVQVREAVPALLELAAQPEHEQEATAALALMPDPRATGRYLQALGSKNNALRDAARQALVALKSEIGDEVTELHRRHELTPVMRRELQAVFGGATPIGSWQLLGGFPKETGEPKLDFAKAPDLTHPVPVGDKSLTWKKVTTTDPAGRIQPGQHLQPTSQVWSLAFTTITSDEEQNIEFLIGSDDQAKLYVNGEKVYEFTTNRGWNGDSLDRGRLQLKKGTNLIYFVCGNDGGPWDFGLSLRLPNKQFAFLYENTPPQLDPQAYRDFAAKTPGDALRGKQLFFDLKGVGCVKCHAVGGQGSKVGPELTGVGAKYPREELIRSVLEPSNRVAESFRVTTVLLTSGRVVQGIVKTDNDQTLELIDSEGKTLAFPQDDVDEKKTSNLSLMPNGLKDGLTLQDFADVIGYLESLK